MWQRLGELWMVGEDAEQAGRHHGREPRTPCEGLGSHPWACAELHMWGARLCAVFTTCAHSHDHCASLYRARWPLGLLSWSSSSLVLYSTGGFWQVCIRQVV